MQERYRRYTVAVVASLVTLLLTYLVISIVILKNGNEYATVGRYVAESNTGPILYNALGPSLLEYKTEMYRAYSPDVTVIGSSRSMQFRAYFFNESFYSLGGLGSSPAQVERLTESLFIWHRPRVLLLVLDFWDYCSIQRGVGEDRQTSFDTVVWLGLPLRLAWRRYLSLTDYWELLRGAVPQAEGNVKKLGISAVIGDNGFGADGSYYYWGRMRHWADAPINVRWSETEERIRDGTVNFARGCRLRQDRVEQLANLAKQLRERGTEVALILAPMPGNILALMESTGGYGYVDELRAELMSRFQESSIEYVDALDGRLLNSPPCEFIDGHHGGEVTYIRLLLAAAAQNPNGVIAGVIAKTKIEGFVNQFAGRTTIADDQVGRAFRANFDFNRAECMSRSSMRGSIDWK